MNNWNEKTTIEKIATIISGIALCMWLIFEILAKSGKVSFADLACYIALCIVCICEAVCFWNTKRVFAYIAIGGTVLMLTIVVLQILLLA